MALAGSGFSPLNYCVLVPGVTMWASTRPISATSSSSPSCCGRWSIAASSILLKVSHQSSVIRHQVSVIKLHVIKCAASVACAAWLGVTAGHGRAWPGSGGWRGHSRRRTRLAGRQRRRRARARCSDGTHDDTTTAATTATAMAAATDGTSILQLFSFDRRWMVGREGS